MVNLGLLDSPLSDLIENERFLFEDGNRRVAACHLTMVRRGAVALVILTELPDNPGMSITNAAEKVAAAVASEYHLNAPSCLWVEHYPVVSGRPEPSRWAVVTFEWVRDERTATWRAHGASWEHLTSEEVGELMGKVKGRRA